MTKHDRPVLDVDDLLPDLKLTATIAFRSIMRGIDRGIAGWPMERPEIAEMDP